MAHLFVVVMNSAEVDVVVVGEQVVVVVVAVLLVVVVLQVKFKFELMNPREHGETAAER